MIETYAVIKQKYNRIYFIEGDYRKVVYEIRYINLLCTSCKCIWKFVRSHSSFFACVVSHLAVKRIGQSEMNYEKILKAIITDLNNLNQ